MTRRLLLAIATAAALTTACQPTRQQQGHFIGAVAGGVLGSQIGGGTGRVAATIAGSLLGGYLGGSIGRQMDEDDRQRAGQALETRPTGESAAWQNPDTGNRYTVTPTRTFDADGRPCREYTTEAWIDGRRETVRGTACRQADGSWQATN